MMEYIEYQKNLIEHEKNINIMEKGMKKQVSIFDEDEMDRKYHEEGPVYIDGWYI